MLLFCEYNSYFHVIHRISKQGFEHNIFNDFFENLKNFFHFFSNFFYFFKKLFFYFFYNYFYGLKNRNHKIGFILCI